jgi:hypothetical protein
VDNTINNWVLFYTNHKEHEERNGAEFLFNFVFLRVLRGDLFCLKTLENKNNRMHLMR